MTKNAEKRSERLKVNVTLTDRHELEHKAQASDKSLSDFLRDAGLGRKSSISSERFLDGLFVLELVLRQLEGLSKECEAGCLDCALLLVKMRQIERTIELFAPAPAAVGGTRC
ncbi:plasmid mobilization protein [Celeribacter marinus]|uniref:plasmid mobilization protein n=1 Tax=Celeribacter marinus TaxID=1397108 RepID=UPI00316D11BD